jgi:hypothetical protein
MTAPGPTTPDGQDARAYDYTRGFSRSDWSWEFLRRNPEFRAAMGRFAAYVTPKIVAPNVTVYRLAREAPSLKDWGLIFRHVAA